MTWLACLDCDTLWVHGPCFNCGAPGEPSDAPDIVNQFDPLRDVTVPGAALAYGWRSAPQPTP